MPNSNTKPEPIMLDSITNGVCDLRVRWNIVKVTTEDPLCGKPRTSYNYSEKRMPWQLDLGDIGSGSLTEIKQYLAAQETEIMRWAQAAAISFDGTDCKKQG